ncbi:MAG: peptidylprolyl isomerase [Ruminococcaceae bacterium]|nr:peptidylprolyl isomerase [Oscillospiraceae bacterium]
MCSLFVTGCEDEEKSFTVKGKPVVTMVVKDYGTIKMELYPDIAPITVANFVGLVEDEFYDGLIFHRVIEDFMIQGGDPEGTGMGGSDTEIKGEFKANGVNNTLSHTRGVVSMARNGYSYDSASSQFFIVHQTSPHLDGQYAAFGIVIEGMDVVDAIATVNTDSNDKPLKDVVIESMTVDSSSYTKK